MSSLNFYFIPVNLCLKKTDIFKKESYIMNKRVKIVATLGPMVEIRGGKNLVKMDTGLKNWMLKSSTKHC